MNVCNDTDLPELEIISLLEEQFPVYRLRADTVIGYDQDDWLHTPLVAPDAALELTTEQIEETLKYFLLCSDRVGQMTKTYSDIDAVTRLLEEKERDLELAARIGQSLLKKNKTLSERNELLEEQVEHIREEVSQLRHDLSMKDELLQFYTSAAEESDGDSTTSTPVRPSVDSGVSVPHHFPLDSLQRKLKDLEEENLSLRSEASHLETETISYEEKEQQLVNDCVKELRDANFQMHSLAEELSRKTDDASRQQEEITHLLSQIVDLQKKAKSYALENEELTQHLGAAKDAQRQLTAELRELEDKYAECMEMLHEAQEELKNLRNKTLPLSTSRRFHSLGLFPMDSLAAEIEGTMRKEIKMEDPDVEEQKLHPKRVFQTVKNLNLMRQQRSALNIPGSNQTSCFTSGRSSRVSSPRSNSIYGSDTGSGLILDNKNSSILEAPDDGSEDSNRRPHGTPGTPGSRDLEAALRRLSLRRDNYLSERRFFEEERDRKLAYLAKEEAEEDGSSGGGEDGRETPTESLLSLCTHPSLGSVWSGYSFTSRSYLPDKLQIVKPLEGSATLHAWQQLAQPHLGGLLDQRPGVVTKGFRTLEQDQEQEEVSWDLDQPEEDERSLDATCGQSAERADHPRSSSPMSDVRNGGDDRSQSELAPAARDRSVNTLLPPTFPPLSPLCSSSKTSQQGDVAEFQAGVVDNMPVNIPGKCSSHSYSTYTYTTCRILHPSDQLTSVSPSTPVLRRPATSSGVNVSSGSFSTSTTPCCTPRRLSLSLSLSESSTNLRDSTRTTSTSLGLVRLLLESGISASVYDPRSWDRGADASGASTPTRGVGGGAGLTHGSFHRRTEPKDGAKEWQTCVDPFLIPPSTPPNSPKHRCRRPGAASSPDASDTSSRPLFQFSPSTEEHPFYDTFLASKPARTILREVLGEAEREVRGAEGGVADDGLTEVSNLGLVDKLRRFRTVSPTGASNPCGGAAALLGPFGTSTAGGGALGGGLSVLNVGLRRNRSYPAMVGASMAMKGAPLLPHTQETHTLHTSNMAETQQHAHTQDERHAAYSRAHTD